MLKVNRFLSIIALFLIVVSMASCGGGGGGSSNGDGGEGGNSSIINPVSTTGQIDAPSSISPSTLTVISGINSQPVNSDGSFSLDLNKDNTQLITAINPEGNPVLMSVIANGQEGMQIAVDVLSTAIALIYLSPGVAQTNPTDAQIVIDYIKSLSETTTLANLLSSKLAANPDILVDPTGDIDIKTAISNALSALITKVQTSGGLSLEAQRTSLLGSINTQTISPSNASGLFLSFDTATNTLSVENGGKRYVDLYVVSPDSRLLFTIGSVSVLEMGIQSYLSDIGFETDSIGRTKESAVIDEFSSSSDVVINAYGPGFYDFTNVWNNLTQSDKDRLISPIVRTGVYDIAVPIISGMIGVDLRICGEQSLITLTQDIMDNYTGAFLYTLETGSNKDFAVVVIGSVYDRLLANGSTIFKGILNECGFNLFDIAISILKAISGATAIVSGGEVVGTAATISLAKAVETFTLSSTTDTTPPTVPTGFTATAISSSQINLSWNASTDDVGVTGYNVYRDGAFLKLVTGTSTSDTGLSPDTPYCYTVSAYDTAGNESGQSNQMCATTLSSGGGTTDDHGDDCSSATSVGYDSSTNGSIETGGDYDYFQIDIPSSGTLVVETSGSTDTYGYLLDSNCATIVENDDSGSGTNFSITETVSSGTYYVAVRGYSTSTTGNFTLNSSFGGITDDHGDDCSSATSVGYDSSTNGSIETGGDYDYFQIDIPSSGTLVVETSGSTDTYGYLLDSNCSTIVEDDDSGSGTNFSITETVSSGTYYVAVRGYSTSTTGSFTLNVSLQSYGGGSFNLPDTGQTLSYTTTFGEDSDYTINPPSYTDNGNGTVTDNVTGFVWQKEDDDTTRQWYEAVSYCDSHTLGGYSNWRLPSKKELITIVNYGTVDPAIDTTYFPNTNASGYWSSTTDAYNTSNAWVMYFSDGYVANYNPKTYSYSVRCVRGGQYPAQSFTDNGNGTVSDTTTGLMWQQEDDNTTRTWEPAIAYCEGFSFAGYSDWRLPNIKELESITDDTTYNPAINTTYFPNTNASHYWSSTTYYINIYNAWRVGFYNSDVHGGYKTNYNYVRCVR